MVFDATPVAWIKLNARLIALQEEGHGDFSALGRAGSMKYGFIELLAPHLPKILVRKCEQLRMSDELDRVASGLSIPTKSV